MEKECRLGLVFLPRLPVWVLPTVPWTSRTPNNFLFISRSLITNMGSWILLLFKGL